MHIKASKLWKSSAHLDKCATAKTVHYFKNRDKIICNKHQSGVIEPFPPVTWIGGKQNNAFLLIDFYIIERLYIPVTIVNSDHAVKASMVN
jgi:hypothetical protein